MIVLDQYIKLENQEVEVPFFLSLPMGVTWDNCRQVLKMFDEAISQLEQQALERSKKQAEESIVVEQ